jgi:predicted glutamine amidotransferase
MCIAVLNLNKQISENDMYLMWQTNRDGAGLVWHDGTELKTFKMLVETDVDFVNFRRQYKKAYAEAETGVVVHFRMATTGTVNESNCHPFIYEAHNEVNALVHNGMLRGYEYSKENNTDTYNFIQKEMLYTDMYIPAHRQRIERLIGSYNKFIVMTGNGDVFILNANSGYWLTDGNWYSNKNFMFFYNRNNHYKNYIKQ